MQSYCYQFLYGCWTLRGPCLCTECLSAAQQQMLTMHSFLRACINASLKLRSLHLTKARCSRSICSKHVSYDICQCMQQLQLASKCLQDSGQEQHGQGWVPSWHGRQLCLGAEAFQWSRNRLPVKSEQVAPAGKAGHELYESSGSSWGQVAVVVALVAQRSANKGTQLEPLYNCRSMCSIPERHSLQSG